MVDVRINSRWRRGVDVAVDAAHPLLHSGPCKAWLPHPPLPVLRMTPPWPVQYGNDVVPLLRKLKYDPKFEPAFRQVGPTAPRERSGEAHISSVAVRHRSRERPRACGAAAARLQTKQCRGCALAQMAPLRLPLHTDAPPHPHTPHCAPPPPPCPARCLARPWCAVIWTLRGGWRARPT